MEMGITPDLNRTAPGFPPSLYRNLDDVYEREPDNFSKRKTVKEEHESLHCQDPKKSAPIRVHPRRKSLLIRGEIPQPSLLRTCRMEFLPWRFTSYMSSSAFCTMISVLSGAVS